MQQIEIIYNSNPNLPSDINHIGLFGELITTDTRIFYDIQESIDFLNECSYSITTIADLVKFEPLPLNIEEEYWETIELSDIFNENELQFNFTVQ